MNSEIFLKIQWIFFILFYWCCTGRGHNKETKASQEPPHWKKNGNEFTNGLLKETAHNLAPSFQGDTNKKDAMASQVELGEEHEHFGIRPMLDVSFNDTIDPLKRNPHLHRQLLSGSSGGDRRRSRRNNDDVDRQVDYGYKIANQDLTGTVTSAIADRDDVNGAGMSSLSSGVIGRNRDDKDSWSVSAEMGRPERKILSIEENSVIYDKDGIEPDDNKLRVGGEIQGFRPIADPFSSNNDDDLKREDGNDVLHRSEDYGYSYGSFVADAPKAYNERGNLQEIVTRSRDKTVSRKPRSTKQLGTGRKMWPDGSTDKLASAPKQTTVYHQHHEDYKRDTSDIGPNCDCTSICAKYKNGTDMVTDVDESSGDVSTVTMGEGEEQTDLPDNDERRDDDKDENERPSNQRVIDEEEEDDDKNYAIEEYSEKPVSTSGEAEEQSEVYIDLKIVLKKLENGSLSKVEPLEVHKKIVVDRSKQKPASVGNSFPKDLVKAIYQLVDSDDSLRTHVAPRLPDRTKLLFNLEQKNRSGGKINDRQPDRDLPGGAGPPRGSRIEQHQNSDMVLADAIVAIGQLIRQKSGH
ncbi:uncharacterized protein LOC131431211 [Malaya genurostris]|uniref:uncharacterized protein LOC131431211 n=1 Tax=Malaya genurostris TaxID=325434 RepID=UPI0026F3EC38|nr:uncharacterized protein LOC131431211 [Malaya genurostris]